MRGFLFWERAKLALQSDQNKKPSRLPREEVFASPLVGVSGSTLHLTATTILEKSKIIGHQTPIQRKVFNPPPMHDPISS